MNIVFANTYLDLAECACNGVSHLEKYWYYWYDLPTIFPSQNFSFSSIITIVIIIISSEPSPPQLENNVYPSLLHL